MKKVNFLSGLFISPKKTLKRVESKIGNLDKKIGIIDKMDNKVEAIVELFRVLSPICDKDGLNQEIEDLNRCNWNGKYNKKLEALINLQAHFENAGRDPNGINRTSKGEEVTADKVFLGNIFGLTTKPASYWLANKAKLEKSLRPDASENPKYPISNWYLINDYHYAGIIESHTKSIVEQIKLLK